MDTEWIKENKKATIAIVAVAVILIGHWLLTDPSPDTIAEQQQSKEVIDGSSGSVTVEKNSEWSEPLPYIDNYVSYTWWVSKGTAEYIVTRDAEHPQVCYTNKFDTKQTSTQRGFPTLPKHLFRPQWMVVGIKGDRPVVVKYKFD